VHRKAGILITGDKELDAWTWPTPAAPRADVDTIPDPMYYTGNKFPGGLAPALDILKLDYWQVRTQSEKLFYANTYARGIVRRFVTNVINTGLNLESTPEEAIIGVPEDSLVDWSEEVENRFYLWGDTPAACDIKGLRGFGQIQRQIYLEALVGGDCLVVLRQHAGTKLPMVQVIQGSRVETPMELMFQPRVVDGVVVDENGGHVGFHVRNDDGKYSYIPARGELTGRPQAWIVYGCDRREDGVRGEPLLSIALQPIAEIDKYRDSAQRKAFLNAAIIGAVERDPSNRIKSRPLSGGAVKRGETAVADATYDRAVPTGNVLPGLFFEGMQPGEKVTFFNNAGTDAEFAGFETAIIVGLAWALEIPPEILLMSFNKNYSASQAAINEWKTFLTKEHSRFGSENNDRIYQDWFFSMALLTKIDAPGYLKAVVDVRKWDVARAWTMADWSGAIKPSTDPLKQVNAYTAAIDAGLNTHERAAREMSGQKFSKIIRRLAKENLMKAEAMRPLLEMQKELSGVPAPVEDDPAEDEDETTAAVWPLVKGAGE
jgi:capsid protein